MFGWPCITLQAASKWRCHCQFVIQQFYGRTHPIRFVAWPKTVLPSFRDRPNFQPLHEPQTVPEILVAGPVERFFARPINAAEQGIENHVLDLGPVPIAEPGPHPPALEAFWTVLREILGKIARPLRWNPHYMNPAPPGQESQLAGHVHVDPPIRHEMHVQPVVFM